MSFDIAKGLAKAKSKKKRSRKSVYDKQREEETIRNATQRGYLRRMTMAFLNENIGDTTSGCDLSKIGYLNVSNSQLSSLGLLDMAFNLRICILPGNYITEFDALGNCVNLWVLDLHGNQIKKVPSHTFWAALPKLQIVLLHDNGISKLETIHHLSSSPSLLVLTLYDTPLSLKKNYRHHVVNGIWCLKALDRYVVSDEEIIEDTKMGGKFSAMERNFRIDLDHGLKREFSYEEAVKHMENFIARINKIQAAFSPVLILQKNIRRYLARKRYKFIMDTRIWAATTIQRFYRFHKGITTSFHDLLPPPSSPLPTCSSTRQRDDDYEQYLSERAKGNNTGVSDGTETAASGGKPSNTTRGNPIHLPTGLTSANHEVGGSMSSVTPAWSSRLNFRDSSSGNSRNLDEWISGEMVGERSSHGHAGNVDGEEKISKINRRMTIDLIKLESSTLETIQSAVCDTDINNGLGSKTNAALKREKASKNSKSRMGADGNQSKDQAILEDKKEETEDIEDLYKRRLKPEKVGKYRTVRVFLGPILQAKSRQEIGDDDSDDDDPTGFRLRGITPPRQKTDPLVDMLLSKKETGEDMRNALRRTKQESRKRAKPVVRRSPKLTNDQRLFLRTHGTMGLACLRAVHQAYGDRKRAREQADKAERVAEMKEKREQVAGRLHTVRQDYQENVLRNRIREGVNIADALRENEKTQQKDRGKVALQRATAVVQERERQAKTTFEKEFASQQTSVSQALRAHDQAELNKERKTKVSAVVRRERETTIEQQVLVKRFMEHRQLVRQTETAKAKADLDAKLLQEANRKFVEIQMRAKKTKNRLAQVKEFYPLPPLNAPAIDTALAILSPGNFSPWEVSLQQDSRQCLSNYGLSNSETRSQDQWST